MKPHRGLLHGTHSSYLTKELLRVGREERARSFSSSPLALGTNNEGYNNIVHHLKGITETETNNEKPR